MIEFTWILDFLRLQQVSYVSHQKIVLSGKRSGWVSLIPDLTLKNNVSNTPLRHNCHYATEFCHRNHIDHM